MKLSCVLNNHGDAVLSLTAGSQLSWKHHLHGGSRDIRVRQYEFYGPLQEAKALKDGALQRGGSFGAVLADYVRSGGALPSQAAQAMASEAERLLRAADRAAWARPSFRHKALLYVLLAGDRRVAEHLLRVSFCTGCS